MVNFQADEVIQDYSPIQDIGIEDINKLNSLFTSNEQLILCTNIRSIFKNISKLENLLCHMVCKPLLIVCTEALLTNENYFINIDGYVHYNSKTRLNESDDIVIYVLETVIHEVENITIGKTESQTITLSLKNEISLTISPIYRSHQYKIKKFSKKLFSFWEQNKNIKNHIVMGDFNIDILKEPVESEDF